MKQVAIIEDVGHLVETNFLTEKSFQIYNLPADIKDVSEIYELEDYKKWRKEKLAQKEKFNLLDNIMQGGISPGNINVLMGKSNVDCGIIDYLKHINKNEPSILKIKEFLAKKKAP